jgi:hypothetical protein
MLKKKTRGGAAIAAVLALFCAGCAGRATSTGLEEGAVSSTATSALRMNQLQALGTHNSYHEARWLFPRNLDYSFDELDVQASEQRVRSFELDLQFKGARFDVYHAWNDPRSTCRKLTDCLRTLRAWSDAHPTHQPLVVLLEAKDDIDDVDPAAYVSTLESTIQSIWPQERLVTPDLVRGDAPTLREAVTQRGWPLLDSVRGRAMFVLTGSSELQSFYTGGGRSLDGRLAFVSSSSDMPYGSFLVMDDPRADGAAIRTAVAAGFFVRTRADAGMKEPRAGDHTRLEAALESGAQIISTDFPAKVDGIDYVATIPDGNPSRCNPVVPVPGCTSAMVEDLGP